MNRFLQPLPQIKNNTAAGPYVGIAETKSGNIKQLNEVGIAAGDPYLAINSSFVRLVPFEFHLLEVAQIYTKMDSFGNFVRGSTEETPGLDEHMVAVILIKYQGKLIPSRSDFRRTKVRLIKDVYEAVSETLNPSWGALNNENRVAMACPFPGGRIVGSGYTKQQAVRSGENQGQLYYQARANVRPSNIADLELLSSSFADSEFVSQLAAAVESMNDRVKTLTKGK